MKEWIEGNVWGVLAIAAPVMMAVLILVSEISSIKSEIKYVKSESERKIEYVRGEIKDVKEESNRKIKYVEEQSERKIKYVEKESAKEIKYVKEQSNREIKYLQERIEDYRKEYNQKWVETNKMLIDLHKDMKKEWVK